MDDRFEPVLGRIRARPSRAGKRYLGRVLAAARLAGIARPGRRGASLSRLGRGASAAAVVGRRRGQRRVVVKTRLVRLQAKGIAAARAHLRYIQRDGVQRDGSAGRLYSAAEDDCDGKGFIERCGGDRHQFRIILSAEDGASYGDLRPLVRRFMARMEADLGTRLEWVAADHLDTGHPHSHIILRGRDDQGRNLVIARDYIAHCMRRRASELVSLDLGPRTGHEIQLQMRRDVDAERLTPLDRALVRAVNDEGWLIPGGRDMADHAIRVARLRRLEGMGLAGPLEGGRWRLSAELEANLRAMGERGDIIRTMQRALTRARIVRAAGDLQLFDAAAGRRIVARLVDRGLADELADTHYLIVDAVDGRSYHVAAGPGSSLESMAPGSILAISPGRVPGRAPRVEVRSALPLDLLPAYDGATWLDQELASADPLPIREAGFGGELRSALDLRRSWLIGRGFALDEGGSLVLKPGALDLLRRRDVELAAERLSRETGRSFVEAGPGERIEGLLRCRVDLGSGRFALVENGREFMLVPWRPSLERHVEKPVAGLMREGRVDWLMGRERGIGR